MQEIWDSSLSLGWEDPLEEGRETHSSVLAWRIPMDRGARQATAHRIARSRTWLKRLSIPACTRHTERCSLWPLLLSPASLAYVVFPPAWNSTLFTLPIFWLHKPHPALRYLLDLHSIFNLNLNEHFKDRFLLQKKSEEGQSGHYPPALETHNVFFFF